MKTSKYAEARKKDEFVSRDTLHRFDDYGRFSGHVRSVRKAEKRRRRLLVSVEAGALAIGSVAAFCAGGVFGTLLGFVLALMCANEMTRR